MKKGLVFFPLFLAVLAFLPIPGSEIVRAVQILSLLGAGMCLGVGLLQLHFLLGSKPQSCSPHGQPEKLMATAGISFATLDKDHPQDI